MRTIMAFVLVFGSLAAHAAQAEAQSGSGPELGGATPARSSFLVETRRYPNTEMLTSALYVFTVAYAPAVLTKTINETASSDYLYTPVAGPWLELARQSTAPATRPLLALSGTFQGLGALFVLVSLVTPEVKRTRVNVLGNGRFSAEPMATRGRYGLSARARF